MNSKKVLMSKWIEGDSEFVMDGSAINCRLCCKLFRFSRKRQLHQHKSTAVHINARKSKNYQRASLNIESSTNASTSDFVQELVSVFLQQGIPLSKLENGPLKTFLDLHLPKPIPCRKTLSDEVAEIFENVQSETRALIGNSPIWCSVGETTDRLGRNVVSVIVGKLDGKSTQGRLIFVTCQKRTRSSTIAQSVQEALRILWQGAPDTINILLYLVTDSADYMLEAVEALKAFYPKMIHLTCMAYALLQVAEAVRREYDDVNKVVSSIKKIFHQAPAMVDLFKKALPEVPLPPQPNRWDKWLEAVEYYATHIDGIRALVATLAEDSSQIAKAKKSLASPGLDTKLQHIKHTYGAIASCTAKLQTPVSFYHSVEEVVKIIEQPWDGVVGLKIKSLLSALIEKNTDWPSIKAIHYRQAGEVNGVLPEEWTLTDAFLMNFAPITQAEVERSFSMLDYLLSDRRTRITGENIEKQWVIFYNNANKNDEFYA